MLAASVCLAKQHQLGKGNVLSGCRYLGQSEGDGAYAEFSVLDTALPRVLPDESDSVPNIIL